MADDDEYFCKACEFAGFSDKSLKKHQRSEKHKLMKQIYDLKNSLDEAIEEYNDLYDAYEELKNTCEKKTTYVSDSECPEDELINVNIFTYTDGIEYLRGVDTGYIYELNGDQDVVGRWDEKTETVIFDEDEEIILKPH
jgi:hypothetical protein